MSKKAKKEKVIYIDDGRTLADMSEVQGGFSRKGSDRPPIRFGDVWKTYWSSVKMVLPAMLVFIAGMGLVYLIAWLLFTFVAK